MCPSMSISVWRPACRPSGRVAAFPPREGPSAVVVYLISSSRTIWSTWNACPHASMNLPSAAKDRNLAANCELGRGISYGAVVRITTPQRLKSKVIIDGQSSVLDDIERLGLDPRQL